MAVAYFTDIIKIYFIVTLVILQYGFLHSGAIIQDYFHAIGQSGDCPSACEADRKNQGHKSHGITNSC